MLEDLKFRTMLKLVAYFYAAQVLLIGSLFAWLLIVQIVISALRG